MGFFAPLIITFSMLFVLLLGGCAAKRNHYDVPALELPTQYAKDQSSSTVTLTDELSSPFSLALGVWWRLLGSEELNGLMDRALANNPDLKIATLRIAQSKARLDQAGGSKLPTLTIPIQLNNTYPEYGVGSGYSNGFNTSRPLSQLSIEGNYRLDIWGEISSLYESAELQLLRITYQRDDMQRNVVASVASSYLEYLSLNDRIRVARETENALGEMLASVDARMEVGDATITEMEQQKAAVYSVKATIPLLEQQREVVLNKLASLLGSAPVALKLSDKGLDSVKFPSVLPGVPSALLLRRPDVRAVESSLLSADADIDVARTRVLPPLDLTAQAGYGSTYMSQLFTPQALFWNTLESLSVTIFDGGKLAKEVEFAKAMHEEMLETYIRVIYDAVREVDDSLSGIKYMSKRLESQRIAADSSLRAWNYSKEVFMAGVVDYIVLLDTQRTYQLNTDNLYSYRLDNFRSLINLFSALGGGVPSGDVLPGQGARPSWPTSNDSHAAVSEVAGDKHKADIVTDEKINISTHSDPSSNNEKGKGIDWTGRVLSDEATQWIVELSGVYDRGAILPAWRDLQSRFPQQMENHSLLPCRQGQVKVSDKERTSWYRLFIAAFQNKKKAEEYCAILAAGQQRCGVVPSKSLADKGDFVAPTTAEQYEIAAEFAVMTVQTPNTETSGKNDKHSPIDHADTVRVKEEIQALNKTEASLVPQVESTKEIGSVFDPATAPIPDPIPDPVPASVPASVPAPVPIQVRALINPPEMMIEHWLADWAEKNVEGYLSHYDKNFLPRNGRDRATWERERSKHICEASSIKVHVKNLTIKRQSEQLASARFIETIEVGGYKKNAQKKLLLILGDHEDEWKILEEWEVPIPETNLQKAANILALKLKAIQAAKTAVDRSGTNNSIKHHPASAPPNVKGGIHE